MTLHISMGGQIMAFFQSPFVLAEVLEPSVLGRKPPYQMGRADSHQHPWTQELREYGHC